MIFVFFPSIYYKMSQYIYDCVLFNIQKYITYYKFLNIQLCYTSCLRKIKRHEFQSILTRIIRDIKSFNVPRILENKFPSVFNFRMFYTLCCNAVAIDFILLIQFFFVALYTFCERALYHSDLITVYYKPSVRI